MSDHTLKAYLASLHELACQTPAPGSLSLLVDGRDCGKVSAQAAKALLDHKHVVRVADGLALEITPDINDKLAEIAQSLQAAGCISKWRGELLDLWCDNNVIGAIERGAVRSLGLLTRAVHLNAWSTRGELWVARRALDKATDPGMWDTLVGGLVGHSESDELALERESAEEAGLAADQIAGREPIRSIYRMQRRVPEGFQYEEVLTSDCVLADDVVPANQDGEVMEIACLPVGEIEAMLFDGLFTVEASIVIAQSLMVRQPS